MVRAAAALLFCGLLAGLGGAAPHSVEAQLSPEQELAEKYAPVLMLREQAADCDHSGEGYYPTVVDYLFDNPDIRLMANSGGNKADDLVLKVGPSVQDLVTAGPDTYLDYPGNPRDPRCQYETYFKQKAAELGLEPTTYARIIVDPVARKTHLQYWFFYYFNHWNNTHEADWEMMQLVFDGVLSVEQALEVGPTSVAYAQHGGGELGRWNDEKLEKDGDRPIGYPSAGSHGTYFSQSTFIGWGENGSAFGCDNTTPPSIETPLQVVLVPTVIDPESDLAFFLYQGNWGERDFAMFAGPKGPNMGGKWSDPTDTIEDWRTTTLKVPGASTGSVNTTDAFCTLSGYGSKVVIYFGSNPIATIVVMLGLLGLITYLVARVWGYFLEALDIYGNELTTFLGIGLLVIPIGLISGLAVEYLIVYPPLEWFSGILNGARPGGLAVSLVVGGFQQLTMLLVILPAVVYAMSDIRRGVKPGVLRSFKGAIRALPVTAPAAIAFGLAVGLPLLFLVLLPLAVVLAVRLQFFNQAAILGEKKPFLGALWHSWNVTRGNFVKALFGSIGFQLMALVPGPLMGVLVLIVGGSKVSFANFLSSFIYALTIPIATIAVTMLYHRLAGHEIVEPTMMTTKARVAPATDTIPSTAPGD